MAEHPYSRLDANGYGEHQGNGGRKYDRRRPRGTHLTAASFCQSVRWRLVLQPAGATTTLKQAAHTIIPLPGRIPTIAPFLLAAAAAAACPSGRSLSWSWVKKACTSFRWTTRTHLFERIIDATPYLLDQIQSMFQSGSNAAGSTTPPPAY
ncbi:Uncharacterised protein [Actinobacillus pleuropneumoniae]|nr:Uncharacterised protein [Actinobacillus pleuropneumoniae]